MLKHNIIFLLFALKAFVCSAQYPKLDAVENRPTMLHHLQNSHYQPSGAIVTAYNYQTGNYPSSNPQQPKPQKKTEIFIPNNPSGKTNKRRL